MSVKFFAIGCALQNQEGRPGEPMGKAGQPFFNSHHGTIEADEWAKKAAWRRIKNRAEEEKEMRTTWSKRERIDRKRE